MKTLHRAVVLALMAPLFAVAVIDCGDDDETKPGPAGTDASLSDNSAPRTDGATQTEASTDASAVDSGLPDSATDSATDAELDAGADVSVDSGPQFDDAGCPLNTGALPDLADAGFPTNGLVLWLRSDRGVATLDGGSVCRWDDMSGNGRSFVPTGPQPPTLAPTGIRNQPAVAFTGDRNMSRQDVLGIAPTSARTVAIFQRLTDTTHRFAFYQGNFATNDRYWGIDQNTFQGDGGFEGAYLAGNAYESNIPTNGLPRSHVYSVSTMVPDASLPGALTYAVDNTVATLTRTAGGTGNSRVWDFSSANRTVVGVANNTFTGGFVGEVLVFDRELTAGERTAVHNYFQTHYPP